MSRPTTSSPTTDDPMDIDVGGPSGSNKAPSIVQKSQEGKNTHGKALSTPPNAGKPPVKRPAVGAVGVKGTPPGAVRPRPVQEVDPVAALMARMNVSVDGGWLWICLKTKHVNHFVKTFIRPPKRSTRRNLKRKLSGIGRKLRKGIFFFVVALSFLSLVNVWLQDKV